MMGCQAHIDFYTDTCSFEERVNHAWKAIHTLKLRMRAVFSIERLSKGLDHAFLSRFSIEELEKYLARLEAVA